MLRSMGRGPCLRLPYLKTLQPVYAGRRKTLPGRSWLHDITCGYQSRTRLGTAAPVKSICKCFTVNGPTRTAPFLPCRLPKLGIVVTSTKSNLNTAVLHNIETYAHRHGYGFHTAVIK